MSHVNIFNPIQILSTPHTDWSGEPVLESHFQEYTFSVDRPKPLSLSSKANVAVWNSVKWHGALDLVVTNLNPSPPSRLNMALAEIRRERIREDVNFIAADERQGRDTPSPGLKQTAEYIRDRLVRLGFKSGSGNDTFFYSYQLRRFQFDVEETHIEIGRNGKSLEHSKDFVFTSMDPAQKKEWQAERIFVDRNNIETLREMDVSGKWIVCHDDEISTHERQDLATKWNAAGVIVIGGADIRAQRKYEHYKSFAESGQSDFVVDQPVDEILLAPHVRLEDVLHEEDEIRSSRSGIESYFMASADNVVGFWEGSHPEKKRDVIILSAHYDHIGVSSDGEINNGADDNASGSAGLLALAEAITKLHPEKSVMIMWVSGEEKGLLGSQAWVKNPSLPEGYRAVANINVDMIGRNDPESLLMTPTSRHPKYNALSKLAEAMTKLEGFTRLSSADQYYSRSDHYSFERLGIPVVFFSSGLHDDYHRPSDTAEKIDEDKIARVSRMVLRLISGFSELN